MEYYLQGNNDEHKGLMIQKSVMLDKVFQQFMPIKFQQVDVSVGFCGWKIREGNKMFGLEHVQINI